MIGIDIVSIDRIKKMHEKFGDKFYDRFLCEDEKEFIKPSYFFKLFTTTAITNPAS